MFYGITTYQKSVTTVIVNILLSMGLDYTDLEVSTQMVTVSQSLITPTDFAVLKNVAKMIVDKKDTYTAKEYMNKF